MRTMYKSEIERRRSKATVLISVCVISLFLLINIVTGQVVIVPNKPKSNNKAKAKPKSKTNKSVANAPAPSPTPTPTLTPAPAPSRPLNPAPAGATTPSPIVSPSPASDGATTRSRIVTPSPASDGATTTSPIVAPTWPSSIDLKRVEPLSRVAPPINLSEYQYDVITSDQRGKVIQSGRNRARYFNENLSDGALIEMVEVPGGTFSMGTTTSEIEQIARDHGRDVEKEMKERLQERLM